MRVLFAIAACLFFNLGEGQPYKIGSKVEVEWSKGNWYPATVTDVSNNQYKVHLDGDGSDNRRDQWIDKNANILRAAKAKAPLPSAAESNTSSAKQPTGTTGNWKAGDKVEAMDAGKWYNAVVREKKDNGYLLHWEGFSSTYDAVVATEHIRKRTGVAFNEEAGTPAEVVGGLPILPGTTWALKSMTKRGDPVKDYSPLPTMDFCKSGKWTLGRYRGTNEGGTYKINSGRVMFKDEDGAVWGDYKMIWNASSGILELTDGNYTIRMIYSSKLNPC